MSIQLNHFTSKNGHKGAYATVETAEGLILTGIRIMENKAKAGEYWIFMPAPTDADGKTATWKNKNGKQRNQRSFIDFGKNQKAFERKLVSQFESELVKVTRDSLKDIKTDIVEQVVLPV